MDLVKVLETYRGKDRIIRLSTYVLMFVGAKGNTPVQCSSPVWSSEANPYLRPLEVVSSLVGQLYYPVEHVAWLRDKEVLPGNSGKLWLFGLCLWVTMNVTDISKCLVRLKILSMKIHHLKKQRKLESDPQSQQTQEIEQSLETLDAERRDLLLNIVQSAADLTNAISWLPKGILWSQRLPPSLNGLIGMVSSAILLIRNWPSK